jgi:multiple antibiotic resistance protein
LEFLGLHTTDAMGLRLALSTFSTFFVTVGPIDVAIIFLGLTSHLDASDRQRLALKGSLLAFATLIVFSLIGGSILSLFGIGMPALRISSGILLFLIAIDITFGKTQGSMDIQEGQDISVFPLGIPLIAGPGTITATVVFMTQTQGNLKQELIILGSLSLVLGLNYALMLLISSLEAILGKDLGIALTRICGILLAALSIQFILDGIAESGLFPGTVNDIVKVAFEVKGYGLH